MKVGTQVRLRESGEICTVEEVRKFIGCPFAVRLNSGRLHWCGPADLATLKGNSA